MVLLPFNLCSAASQWTTLSLSELNKRKKHGFKSCTVVFFCLVRKKCVNIIFLDMLRGRSSPFLTSRSLEHFKTFLISFDIVEASSCRHSPGRCIPSRVWASTRPTGGPEWFHPGDPEPRLPAATGTHTATSCKSSKNKMCFLDTKIRPQIHITPEFGCSRVSRNR